MRKINFQIELWLLMSAAMLLVLSSGCKRSQDAPPQPPPPPVVEVAAVIQKDVPIYSEWIGTLQGYVNAQIQPQVTGYLIRQDYQEGSWVRKGQVLFEIDPRPFQAALDEAQAHAIPQSQLDNDTQAKLAAEAAVAAGKAAVEQAQLNLNYTQVRSLIDGIAGIAQVQVGNLVTPSTVLTAVSEVNPIKAYFPISGIEYLRIAERLTPGAVNLLPGASPIPLKLILPNGATYRYQGRILFADRQLDPQTGTLQVVGAFPNPAGILRPGETARIRAVTELKKGALLVPQAAVTELQGGYQVAVVGPGNKISIRSVQVGPRVGTLWMITEGLKMGERVVVEGTEKVRDGMAVTPQPYTPRPQEH